MAERARDAETIEDGSQDGLARLQGGLPRKRLRSTPDVEPIRVVARRRGDLVFVEVRDIWAFEAADRLTFVHCKSGRFDLDVSLAELETLLGANVVRPHRNWLVIAAHVREWRRRPDRPALIVGGLEGAGLEVPVAADRLPALRQALLAGAVGLRRRSPSRASETESEDGAEDSIAWSERGRLAIA
jgi:DNA-binding LytR/AlgR family response regulator